MSATSTESTVSFEQENANFQRFLNEVQYDYFKALKNLIRDESKVSNAVRTRYSAQKGGHKYTLIELEEAEAFNLDGSQNEAITTEKGIIIDSNRSYADRAYYANDISPREKLVIDAVVFETSVSVWHKHHSLILSFQDKNNFFDEVKYGKYLRALTIDNIVNMLSIFNDIRLDKPMGYQFNTEFLSQLDDKINQLEANISAANSVAEKGISATEQSQSAMDKKEEEVDQVIEPLSPKNLKAQAATHSFKITHKAGVAGGIGLMLLGGLQLVAGLALTLTGVGGPIGLVLLGTGATTATVGALKSVYHTARLVFASVGQNSEASCDELKQEQSSFRKMLSLFAYTKKLDKKTGETSVNYKENLIENKVTHTEGHNKTLSQRRDSLLDMASSHEATQHDTANPSPSSKPS